jgi:hypothetical protein
MCKVNVIRDPSHPISEILMPTPGAGRLISYSFLSSSTVYTRVAGVVCVPSFYPVYRPSVYMDRNAVNIQSKYRKLIRNNNNTYVWRQTGPLG